MDCPTLMRLLVLLLVMLLVAGRTLADDQAGPEPPVGASLNEQVIRIPGDEPPAVTIQTTIMHPDGNGPFPLAIMNHGADGNTVGRRGTRYHLTNAAFYFLSRGYAVALPMMRGFSTTGGEIYHFGCNIADTGLANAKDIAAVIHYLGNDPRFDTRRVIVAGQSMGGWNTLAVGALALPNVAGLVNFNGGLRESDCKFDDLSLEDGAATFGARTKVPSIWFYGDNDQLFAPPLWRAMFDRYTRAGGRAELVDVGPVMTDSHNFLAYPEVLPLWTVQIDQFLARIGMPHTAVHPNDLPTTFPPASQFADLSDVNAVPFISTKGRDAYRDFLTHRFPRAFVITRSGGVASTTGGFDPLGRAFAACGKVGVQCQAYAVDDRVVWTRTDSTAERVFNLTLPAGQRKTVNFSVRLNPGLQPQGDRTFPDRPAAGTRTDRHQREDRHAALSGRKPLCRLQWCESHWNRHRLHPNRRIRRVGFVRLSGRPGQWRGAHLPPQHPRQALERDDRRRNCRRSESRDQTNTWSRMAERKRCHPAPADPSDVSTSPC